MSETSNHGSSAAAAVSVDAADGAGDVISASKVRRAIWERRVDQLARYLPDVTRAYLSSEAARPIIRRIQALPRPA